MDKTSTFHRLSAVFIAAVLAITSLSVITYAAEGPEGGAGGAQFEEEGFMPPCGEHREDLSEEGRAELKAEREARQAAREAVRAAIEADDYEAFVQALSEDDGKLGEQITSQDQFESLVEAHTLREAGDYEGAKAVLDELGIKPPHRGAHMRFGQGQGYGMGMMR